MTPDDVTDLLEFCAGYDHRHITGEEAEAWHKAIGHLDLDDAREAVVGHYRDNAERVKPAHIRARCRSGLPPVPPRLDVAAVVAGRGAERMRQSLRGVHVANQARRERVLRYPDLAKLLTEPPLGYREPGMWNGFVPPAEGQDEMPEGVHSGAGQPNAKGRRTGATRKNDSPKRAALVDICAEAWRREHEGES